MAKPIHSNIRVLDEQRSIAFYHQAFDLDMVDRVPFEDFVQDPDGYKVEVVQRQGRYRCIRDL